MGVLDDAIREHLELKRRHGASEDELAVKEEEALGAARGEAPPASAEPAEDAQADGEDDLAADLFDVESFGDGARVPAESPPEDQPTRFVEEPPFAEEPFAQDPPPAEPPVAEPPLEGDPLDEPDDPRRSDIVDQPTEVHPPPPAADPPWAEPEGEGEGEDVLEETPEFLQETPEHDRLWFEQKPPRDFDFDDEDDKKRSKHSATGLALSGGPGA
jgi:hypothetical protein